MKQSSRHFSLVLLAVVLSPGLLQIQECGFAQGAQLESLEVVTAGVDRIVAFRPGDLTYLMGTTAGVDTMTVRAQATEEDAEVTYELSNGSVLTSGALGTGGGEVELSVPLDSTLTLKVSVRGGSGGLVTVHYTIEINPECSPAPCDDSNSCSVDICNAVDLCEFTEQPDMESCETDGIGGGVCDDGLCEATGVVDFESFGPVEAEKKLGLELDAAYAGLTWAYDPPADPTDIDKRLVWGNWAPTDSSSEVPGASGSENWLKARASSVGKGAKITGPPTGFVFDSMKLYTRDPSASSAFLQQVVITARPVAGSDIVSVPIDLQPETWVEITAAQLEQFADVPSGTVKEGLIDGNSLKSIWFNAVDESSPNSAKFGLDDFTVIPD